MKIDVERRRATPKGSQMENHLFCAHFSGMQNPFSRFFNLNIRVMKQLIKKS